MQIQHTILILCILLCLIDVIQPKKRYKNKYKTSDKKIVKNEPSYQKKKYRQSSKYQKVIKKKMQQKSQPKHEVIMVVGGPGSGKGTLCTQLLKQFDFIHISTGDLLRKFPCDSSFLSYYFNCQMAHALFVKTQLLVTLVKLQLSTYKEPKIFLLDGYPRNQQNVDVWVSEIGDTVSYNNLLFTDCPDKVLEERLVARGKSSGRSDDNLQTITNRIKAFNQETKTVVLSMNSNNKSSNPSLNLKVITINANQPIQKVSQQAKDKLIKMGYKLKRKEKQFHKQTKRNKKEKNTVV